MDIRRQLALGVMVFALAGCVMTGTTAPTVKHPAMTDAISTPSEYLAKIRKDAAHDELNDGFVVRGIAALEDGNLAVASKSFSRALKFDPTNSGLHFLNGLTYHLMAAKGDASMLDFAEVGYDLALKFDPANSWAAYQLGLIRYRKQDFAQAQDDFAYAANYLPDNEEVLTALSAASYQARDVLTAKASVDRLLARSPDNPDGLRNAVMIYGAAGELDRADEYLRKYSSLKKNTGFRVRKLQGRLNEWRGLHADGIQLAQGLGSASDILGSDNTTSGVSPSSDDSGGGFGSSSSDTGSSAGGGATKPKIPKMVLADVIIIRSEERVSTSKGVNLLNGLTLSYSGTLINWSQTSTLNSPKAITGSRTHAVTIPSVTYNLNIFSDSDDVNEVLARPTLVAVDGKKSEFFSGAVWHVELSSSDSNSSAAVQDVPIGIKLDLTPTFLDEDTVMLDVTAARAFIESRASQANFTNFAQTTKTTVTANAVLKFGQTLVLSGLNEKETEKVTNGVPFLRELPIIQYGFENQATLDFNKSVLILITPRKPQFTEADGTPRVDAKTLAPAKPAGNVKRLQSRTDWNFTPAKNLDAVMFHMRKARFFNHFRSGDVTLEHWDELDSVSYKLFHAIEFLYF